MILVERLTVRAGQFALREVNLHVPQGEYAILMGRTGSGKTTLLEGVCGLKPTVGGRVLLGERDVTHCKPAERGIGFVPQDGAMFHTMSVREQLGFSLRIRKCKAAAIRHRVEELATLLGLTKLLHRKPHGLSGGEQQRVALGRALAAKPAILCLDEPFSALDEDTRREMYDLMRAIHEQTHVTTLHITHSGREMQQLADCLFVLQDGRIEQQRITANNESKQKEPCP